MSFSDAQIYESWFESKVGASVKRLEDALILKLRKELSGKGLLEIGSGSGAFAETFELAGVSHYEGLEPEEAMLGFALRERSQYKFSKGFAEELPFPDNSFDVCAFVTSLEFVDDVYAAINEAARVSSGGLLAAYLNAESPVNMRRREKVRQNKASYPYKRFFSEDELVNVFAAVSARKVKSASAVFWEKENYPGFELFDRILTFSGLFRGSFSLLYAEF